MKWLKQLLQTEPARLMGAITAILGLVVGAGIMSQVRADAWIMIIGVLLPVLLPILQTTLTRRNVYAPDTVQEVADASTFLPAGTSVNIGQPPDAIKAGAPQG